MAPLRLPKAVRPDRDSNPEPDGSPSESSECPTVSVAHQTVSVSVGQVAATGATGTVSSLVSDSALLPSSVKSTFTLDGLAVVGRGQRVGAACCSRDVAARPEPLVGVAGRFRPSVSMMFVVPAVSVMPTCAAPVIPGLPVAESSAESLSVMVPVKSMVLGVASPALPVTSIRQRMVIVSLLSAAASSVMAMSRLAWVSPAGTVIMASAPEMKLT